MAEEINDEFYSVPESEEENTLDSDEVLQAAKKAFGISYFFPWQRIVIANILDSANPGNDILKDDVCSNGRQIVLLPTGAGKSLCFLAPALLLDKPTLVIYPLLALISDQKRRMDEGGLDCVVFRGGQTDLEREENFMRIKNGAKVIITNPEALQNKNLLERLCSFGIVHIAIDEAHCVSEWGDSFRPAYLNLGKVIKKINPPVVTAFTATASENVLSRVSEVLFDGEAKIVRSESDRPNIHYQVIKCYAKKRTAFLLALTEQKPLIIFCGTRAKSEDMARELSAYCGNDKVKFYHAGMSREEKQKVEKWFYPKDDAILCCTCAFGMGVDKKNIRTVIHLEPSPSAESYIQESVSIVLIKIIRYITVFVSKNIKKKSNYKEIIKKMNELDDFLFENGLTLADVIEPDLNKQKEYHKLLVAILNAEGQKQKELIDYAYDILRIEKKGVLTL